MRHCEAGEINPVGEMVLAVTGRSWDLGWVAGGVGADTCRARPASLAVKAGRLRYEGASCA